MFLILAFFICQQFLGVKKIYRGGNVLRSTLRHVLAAVSADDRRRGWA
jgi:hypothetical protein